MKFLITGIFLLPWLCFASLAVANSRQSEDINNINTIPEPGWSVWRPKSEISQADFSSGFSNLELGGYLDFEHACAQSSGMPQEKIDYWFRLTNSVNRIGTGKVEYGCRVKGRFFHRFTSTAIKSSLQNVTCLQVNFPIGDGLLVRAEPRKNFVILGAITNNTMVEPTSFPAVVVESHGCNWLAISVPVKGWVSDGIPIRRGNLELCKR